MLGVTARRRIALLMAACTLLVMLGIFLWSRWGLAGFLLPAILFGIAIAASREVAAARDELWRAACLPLSAPGQRPASPRRQLSPPTAAALLVLADVVDRVRRGRYADANDLLPRVDRGMLRDEERHLYDAAVAMISLGIGDAKRAAQKAVIALPTGSDDLDQRLGRAVIADAWRTSDRLDAIARAWRRAGVDEQSGTPLAKLSKLMRVRIDDSLLDKLSTDEARALSEEARAIGDADLAAELDVRTHRRAYR